MGQEGGGGSACCRKVNFLGRFASCSRSTGKQCDCRVKKCVLCTVGHVSFVDVGIVAHATVSEVSRTRRCFHVSPPYITTIQQLYNNYTTTYTTTIQQLHFHETCAHSQGNRKTHCNFSENA